MSIYLWLLWWVVLAGHLGPVQAQETERRVFTMGTWLDVHADSPATAETAIRQIEHAASVLSRWQPGSEIARMNAGEPIAVSSSLVSNALVRAAKWQRWSDGAFQFRDGKGQLDTDAFAKGAALDQAIKACTATATGQLTLNFGGQVAVAGREQARWSGQLSAPMQRSALQRSAPLQGDQAGASAARLELGSGSFSSSGNAVKPGHIRDPETGQPVLTRGQVTVWATNAFDADCASTACFVLGPERALNKVNSTPDLECCFEWFEQQNGKLIARRLVSKHWNNFCRAHPTSHETKAEGRATTERATTDDEKPEGRTSTKTERRTSTNH